MKIQKRNLIIMSAVCVLLLGGICTTAVFATLTPKAVQIGDYKATAQELRRYVTLSAISDDEALGTEEAAREYAKTMLAFEEIKGTKYAVPASRENEIRKQAEESFDNNSEEDAAFCAQAGITREEMIESVTQSKWNILVRGQHMSMVLERLSAEGAFGEEATTQEQLNAYDRYIEEKIGAMRYKVLDEAKVAELNTYSNSLAERQKAVAEQS